MRHLSRRSVGLYAHRYTHLTIAHRTATCHHTLTHSGGCGGKTVTFETGQEELTAICQYLGLGDDPDSHATYATEAHRCYRMPNPTKIATTHQESYCLVANHTACPVFRGEVAPRPGAGAPAGAAAGGAGAARGGARPFGGGGSPRPGKASDRPLGAGSASGRAPRPDRPVLPRPRSGGISLPVLTVALFAMAVIVVIAAFVIQRALSNGDDSTSSKSAADTVATQAAIKTGTANTGNKTPGAQTPAASGTAGANKTAVPGTPGTPGTAVAGATGTPGPGGKTYVVKSGDFCGTIAAANNITTDQLIAANPSITADCSNLQIGQTLKLP